MGGREVGNAVAVATAMALLLVGGGLITPPIVPAPPEPASKPDVRPRPPAQGPAAAPPAPSPAGREVFPHVRLFRPPPAKPATPPEKTPAEPDKAPGRPPAQAPTTPVTPPAERAAAPAVAEDAAWVEFDGTVPVDCHNPETPRVELELIVCTPDSKEHESLVMSKARPAHIHAALLLLGLEPGEPGRIDVSGPAPAPIAPKGPAVRVTIRYVDEQGAAREVEPSAWIINGKTGERFGETKGEAKTPKPAGFVFAGSRFVKRRDPGSGRTVEVYDADSSGTVVGLTTFGSEVIAWREVISPDSWIQEPVWLADRAAVPKVGTPVVVRISVERPAPASK